MKHLLLIPFSIISLSIYSQMGTKQNAFLSKKNNYRITQSQYYEFSKSPKYKYDYKYDNEGLLISITKNKILNNTWLPTESREFKYDISSNTVVGKYIRGGKPKRDVDTFKIEGGNVIYLAQFREGPNNDYLNQYYYTYQNGNLTNMKKNMTYYIETVIEGKKVSKPNSQNGILQIGFLYEGVIIKNIVQQENSSITKYLLKWNNDSLEKVDVINADGKTIMQYAFKNENNKIKEMNIYMLKDNDKKQNIGTYYYKYDLKNNLIEDNLSNDSGYFSYEYTYDSGNGNASLFLEKASVYDYFKPSIK